MKIGVLGTGMAGQAVGEKLAQLGHEVMMGSRKAGSEKAVCNTDSLAEQIQRTFPEARVVKTLNTVNTSVMVNPASVPGDHVVFVSGNDADAKRTVVEILGSIGWPERRVYDLGDISTARGPEMYMALWLRLIRVVGGPGFNIEIRRAT